MPRITVPVCEGRWHIYIYIYIYHYSNNGLNCVENLKTYSLSYRNTNYLFTSFCISSIWGEKSPVIPLNPFLYKIGNAKRRMKPRQLDTAVQSVSNVKVALSWTLTAWKTLQLSKCSTDLNGNFETKMHFQICSQTYNKYDDMDRIVSDMYRIVRTGCM
jgi:hypothetical protein